MNIQDWFPSGLTALISLQSKGLSRVFSNTTLICRVPHVKCQTGWLTSWNQYCQEKYQQPQIYRWYHPNGKKWRGTKEPLDEVEREEWKKNGLKLSIQKIKIKASGPITSWQVDGGKWKQWQTLFSWAPKSLQTMIAAMKSRHLLLGRKVMTNLDSILKNRDITLLTNVLIVKTIFFFSSHVRMWELDHREGWAPKNWCFWILMLEKTLGNPLDSKEIKPVNYKGKHP